MGAASTATAQEQRSEVTGFVGYTASEGVKTDPGSLIGEVVDEVNPTSGLSYGFSYGFFVTEQAEVGFQWGQQASTLEIVGSSTRELADLTVNNYHGIFTYNLGDSRDMVRPFIFGGLGATNYSTDDIMGVSVESQTKFSSTWGGGVKVFPNPAVGLTLAARWTPTYIKSDAGGVYC
jgi:opacity protein-like surface antigen